MAKKADSLLNKIEKVPRTIILAKDEIITKEWDEYVGNHSFPITLQKINFSVMPFPEICNCHALNKWLTKFNFLPQSKNTKMREFEFEFCKPSFHEDKSYVGGFYLGSLLLKEKVTDYKICKKTEHIITANINDSELINKIGLQKKIFHQKDKEVKETNLEGLREIFITPYLSRQHFLEYYYKNSEALSFLQKGEPSYFRRLSLEKTEKFLYDKKEEFRNSCFKYANQLLLEGKGTPIRNGYSKIWIYWEGLNENPGNKSEVEKRNF